MKKIETCGMELTKWSKNNFGNVRRELEKKRKLLTQAERVTINGGSVHTLKKLEQEINVLMDRESKLWRQRAKIQWLKDGDRNTIFFFTTRHHNGGERTTSRGCIIMRGSEIHILAELQTPLCSFIKICSLLQVRTALRKF